jgi:hypothetical protein
MPISAPLLVVAGERENKTVKKSQSSIVNFVTQSAEAVVPKAGHTWGYENPILFYRYDRTIV